jgi:tRNA pseudouridine32 synthase/23S rRNA pseudouridine746 synthase
MKPNLPFFNSLSELISKAIIPAHLMLMKEDGQPHPLCVIAIKELQQHLSIQNDWQHNFGLSKQEGAVIGKMFGVLVVENQDGIIGYLAAFSGKLAGSNHHNRFVPPVFDLLSEDGFLNMGMNELTTINDNIKKLDKTLDKIQIALLKTVRKKHSIALQQQIFEHYHFLNQMGEEKSLLEIFKKAGYKNPPAGAGECAGPKLLQYAFQHQLKPLALAEFWWGQSPKSSFWKHGEYYACCKEKCEPILAHMLKGLKLSKFM